MASFRDIKRDARSRLHQHMQVAAVYVEDPSDDRAFLKPVSVRIHYKYDLLGGLKGTSFHTVEREEQFPKAVFLVAELPNPRRGAYLSVDLGEAYAIDHTDPADDLTITAHLLRVEKTDLNNMPFAAKFYPDPNDLTQIYDVIIRVNYQYEQKRVFFMPTGLLPAVEAGAYLKTHSGQVFRVSAPTPSPGETVVVEQVPALGA